MGQTVNILSNYTRETVMGEIKAIKAVNGGNRKWERTRKIVIRKEEKFEGRKRRKVRKRTSKLVMLQRENTKVGKR